MSSKNDILKKVLATMPDDVDPASVKLVDSFLMSKADCAAKVASGEWIDLGDGVYEE